MRLLHALPIVLAALGATAVSAAEPTPQPTMLDMAGQVVTQQLSGGIADPVPLFAGPSGPVLFVITPDEAQTPLNKPHAVPKARTLQTTHVGERR
jgi:hypothetical protein